MFSACFTLQSNKGEIYFFFVMKAVTFIYLQGLASGTLIKKKKVYNGTHDKISRAANPYIIW